MTIGDGMFAVAIVGAFCWYLWLVQRASFRSDRLKRLENALRDAYVTFDPGNETQWSKSYKDLFD